MNLTTQLLQKYEKLSVDQQWELILQYRENPTTKISEKLLSSLYPLFIRIISQKGIHGGGQELEDVLVMSIEDFLQHLSYIPHKFCISQAVLFAVMNAIYAYKRNLSWEVYKHYTNKRDMTRYSVGISDKIEKLSDIINRTTPDHADSICDTEFKKSILSEIAEASDYKYRTQSSRHRTGSKSFDSPPVGTKKWLDGWINFYADGGKHSQLARERRVSVQAIFSIFLTLRMFLESECPDIVKSWNEN